VSDTIQVATVPAAPLSVTASRLASDRTSVVVNWAAGPNGGEPITGYKAYVTTDSAKACTTTGALTCTITGLSLTESYVIAVKATNSVGTGPATNSATVTSLLPYAFSAAPLDMRLGAGSLTFSLPADAARLAARASVSLRGPDGRVLWSRTVAVAPGANRVSWDGGDVVAGV